LSIREYPGDNLQGVTARRQGRQGRRAFESAGRSGAADRGWQFNAIVIDVDREVIVRDIVGGLTPAETLVSRDLNGV
jgi:hypothetical protein